MAQESGQGALIDITVKTLDGQNRTFNVPEKLNVRQFKEKISSNVEVPADNQRLIFQGRVMQDDKILKDYDIHGKVIHLVQRAPPTSASASSNSTTTAASATTPDRPHIPLDGNLLDVQIHLGRVQNTPTTREARARLRQADFNLRLVNDVLAQLEQRLGSLSDNSVTQGLSRSQGPPFTTDAATVPADVVGQSEDASVADTSSQTERDQARPESLDSSESREQTIPQAQASSDPAGGVAGDVLGLMAADLANFLDQVLSTNERVASHIRLYRDILRSELTYPAMSREAQDVQEVASRATEVFHALGHMLHSLSDVVVDMGADMPRQAVATPSAPFPFPGIPGIPGTTSMAIPIHMNVRARHSSSGRRQRQNQAGSATSTTAVSTSTVPTASTAAPTASFSGASTPTLAAINISSTNPSIRSFQTPSVPLTLPPNVTTTGEPSVMVEVLPAGITVHDIRTVVTASGMDDDSDSSADSVDNIGINTTDITITPTVTTDHPLLASAATSSSATTAAPLPSASLPAAAIPVTASTGTFTSTGTSQAFIFGPGASMNIREVPSFGLGQGPSFAPGQMPRVPGLPSGMLQNIVGSILNSHGIRPDQPVQVNVVQQVAEIPTAQPPQAPQQEQNNLDGGRAEAPQLNRNQQQAIDQFLSGFALPGAMSTAMLNPFHINISAGSPANTTTASATSTAAPSTTATPTAATISFGSTNRNSFPSGFSWSNPVPPSFGTATDPSPNVRLTTTPRPQFHFHQFGSPGQARPQQGQPRPPASGPLRRSYVDPYLPCSSPHYMSQTALATFSTMQAQSRGQQAPEQIPNLSTMVSGMVGDIMEQVTAAANGENRIRSSTTSTSTSSSSTPLRATTTTTTAGLRPQHAALNPREMFTHLLSRQTGSTPINLQSQSTPLPTTSDTAATRGPAAAPAGWTLADLFTRVGRTSGDVTVIISLLEAVAPHMGLTDLFSLFMGNTRVLNQLREPLQVFVRRQVTHFGSVDQVVEAALADMYPEIQHLQSLVELKNGLDLAESLRNCLRVHLKTIFTAIHSDNTGSQGDFGNHMYSLWMKMMADSIGLCIYCMRDGQTGFSNMVQSYMPRMTQGMSPAITVWMTTSLQDIFQSFYHNHPVTDSDIVGYIAKTQPERSAGSTSLGLGQSSVSGGHLSTVPDHVTLGVCPGALSGSSSPSPMDTSEPLPSQLPQGKVTRLALDEDLDENDIFEDAQESIMGQAPLQNRPNTIAVQNSRVERAVERSGNLRNGRSSDDWQSVVPQDWIPVISRDIIRQQNQRPQPPLSDAYLQGLPAKRRRMMSLEHADEMGNMPLYLPTSLKRAARTADVEPISSEENMAQEAADDLDLQTELEREVIRMLASRITSDQDFTSDRFPNAKEYFHKSNHR